MTWQNFHTKAALMICSARASLPQAYTRNGDIKENRWVSFLLPFRLHNTLGAFRNLISCFGLYIKPGWEPLLREASELVLSFFNGLMRFWMNRQARRIQRPYRMDYAS